MAESNKKQNSDSVINSDYSQSPRWHRTKQWLKAHKKLSVIAGVLIIVLLGLLTPARYPVLNTFTSAQAEVKVLDSKSGQPVSKATIELAGKSTETDQDGVARLEGVDYGRAELRITKAAYRDQTSQVTLAWPHNSLGDVQLEATGTALTLKIVNRINYKPASNIEVTYTSPSKEEAKAVSNKDGNLTLVVPPTDEEALTVNFNAAGWLNGKTKLHLHPQEGSTQTIAIVPEGKIYYLSKRTGKIDLVKSNLDGSERRTVVAGTGKESEGDTSVLASRDWRYMVLKSRRAGAYASLYLIQAGSDNMTVLDEGKARFTPIGWYNQRFIYKVDREGGDVAKSQSLKSYNTDTGQITVLDSSEGSANKGYTNIGDAYILENEVVYTRYWYVEDENVDISNKPYTLNRVAPDGSGKIVIKSIKQGDYSYINIVPYKPQELYVTIDSSDSTHYYEYEAGKLSEDDSVKDFLDKPYFTYLISPDGTRSFWSEPRDGKGTFFIGDKKGNGPKSAGALKDYAAFGWFTEDYLLVSKDRSELFIMGTDGPTESHKPLKIADYHKPDYNFGGYGYGYGGL